jgi:phage shock protein E
MRIITCYTRMLTIFAALIFAAGCAQESAPASATVGAEITAAQLNERIANNTAPLILDVRSSDEYTAGHLPNALNIVHTEFVEFPAETLALLPANPATEIVIHCVSGKRAGISTEVIVAAGYTNVRPLTGNFQGWQAANYAIVID